MGIPPMIGFFSKLFILLNIIKLKMYFFALFLIILNSIGVIYYLRFIKMLYFSTSNKFLFLTDLGEIKALFLVLLVYLNIFFFLYPDYILLIIHNIILYIF
jgi:NADH-quinone oxidoreductase subunit N